MVCKHEAAKKGLLLQQQHVPAGVVRARAHCRNRTESYTCQRMHGRPYSAAASCAGTQLYSSAKGNCQLGPPRSELGASNCGFPAGCAHGPVHRLAGRARHSRRLRMHAVSLIYSPCSLHVPAGVMHAPWPELPMHANRTGPYLPAHGSPCSASQRRALAGLYMQPPNSAAAKGNSQLRCVCSELGATCGFDCMMCARHGQSGAPASRARHSWQLHAAVAQSHFFAFLAGFFSVRHCANVASTLYASTWLLATSARASSLSAAAELGLRRICIETM